MAIIRGGVEDTKFEAKAKDRKKIRGQGPTFQEQEWSTTEDTIFLNYNMVGKSSTIFKRESAYDIAFR